MTTARGVVAAATGLVLAACATQTTPLSDQAPLAGGAVATDRITLAKRKPKTKALPAVVRAVEYLGTSVAVAVESLGEGEMTVTVGDAAFFASPVEIGQSVFLTWKPEDAHKLAA